MSEDEPATIDLRVENQRLMARLRSLETAAKNVMVDLARERRIEYEDPEEGDEISMAKDQTEATAIELAKVLGGDTIPEWVLNPPTLELPFQTLEKIAQLLADPPRPSEQLRAAAKRVREDRLGKKIVVDVTIEGDDVTSVLQKLRWSTEETDAFAKLHTLDKSHANWAIILEGIDPENPCLLRLRYFAERDGWPI